MMRGLFVGGVLALGLASRLAADVWPALARSALRVPEPT